MIGVLGMTSPQIASHIATHDKPSTTSSGCMGTANSKIAIPNAIATCHCGEWLAGSKAAVLARLGSPTPLKEVDLQPYRVDEPEPEAIAHADDFEDLPATPRSVRIVAKGASESVNTVFTIVRHPLWIGRKGCHVEPAEAELSIRHCSISVRGSQLVVRDADSHM